MHSTKIYLFINNFLSLHHTLLKSKVSI
uniref:Uncharacterized protein n=1 Tax=Rhizophora mucronata TaxID=61149 RepID=A0A2P2P9S1_RHIMU